MKHVLFIVILLIFVSCDREKSKQTTESDMAAYPEIEKLDSQEEETRAFTKKFISDMNDSDWQSKAATYIEPGEALDAFLIEHIAFRNAFPDYKMTIKHIMVEGNEVFLWLSNEGTYTNTYTFENSTYGDETLRLVDADNQKLSWDETWYFDMVDGRFGNKWEFIKDHKKVMEGLGLKMVP